MTMADSGSEVAVAITKAGIEIILQLLQDTKSGLKDTFRNASRAANKAAEKKINSGKMSVKRLQNVSGGDLHAQPISPELVSSLKKDLKKRGVNFSIEKGADGKKYVHFAGRDVDSMKHAINQAETKISNKKTKKEVLSDIKTKQAKIRANPPKAAVPKQTPKLGR